MGDWFANALPFLDLKGLGRAATLTRSLAPMTCQDSLWAPHLAERSPGLVALASRSARGHELHPGLRPRALLKALCGGAASEIPDGIDLHEAVVDVRDGSNLVFSGLCALSPLPGRDALGGAAANAADGARVRIPDHDFPVLGFCGAFRTAGACALHLIGRTGIVASVRMNFLSLTHGPCLDADDPACYGYEYAVGLVHEGTPQPALRGDPGKRAITRAGVILAGWDNGLDRFDAGHVIIGESPFGFRTRKEFLDSNRCRSQ